MQHAVLILHWLLFYHPIEILGFEFLILLDYLIEVKEGFGSGEAFSTKVPFTITFIFGLKDDLGGFFGHIRKI